MFLIIENYVRIAVDRIGGPTKAAHAMAVSNTTIHAWIKQRNIRNLEKAKLMAKLAHMELGQLRSASQ